MPVIQQYILILSLLVSCVGLLYVSWYFSSDHPRNQRDADAAD